MMTEADRKFLEKFTNLVKLSLNVTGLKSFDNFPKVKLIKLALCANSITGAELPKLV